MLLPVHMPTTRDHQRPARPKPGMRSATSCGRLRDRADRAAGRSTRFECARRGWSDEFVEVPAESWIWCPDDRFQVRVVSVAWTCRELPTWATPKQGIGRERSVWSLPEQGNCDKCPARMSLRLNP